jgi:hypothetical protein
MDNVFVNTYRVVLSGNCSYIKKSYIKILVIAKEQEWTSMKFAE